MLDNDLRSQLSAHFEKIEAPLELVAALDDSPVAQEMDELLNELASLSPRLSRRMARDGEFLRTPTFGIARAGKDARVAFAGVPMGHEFTSLVLAILQVGGYPPRFENSELEAIASLRSPRVFETYISLTCHNCPEVVQALNAMAALNPNVSHTMIDGAVFESEVQNRQIMAVPTVFLNGQAFAQGRMSIGQILEKADASAAHRSAATLSDKAPFDVLVVGGGPAGAAAAVYAARKGIRTGIVTERFGGQVGDTVGIENLISVPYTEGPKLVSALETHVRAYDVDVMIGQRVAHITKTDAVFHIRLESGATLSSKTVILSPGAAWREMHVPGEAEYRTKGVTFCPHCDGPMFKGKRVAVIGGGNSGIEAAIDLAGVTDHVTVIEFDTALRADAVLQTKLRSLGNIDVRTNAQTTEIIGDGSKVTGLVYRDRSSSDLQTVELSGVFVQIGLTPSTAFVKDVIQLSPRGEIEIDAKGQTSVPGIFAAGDATTSPYKQIIIAMGDGAKAALSAFDYLIRQ